MKQQTLKREYKFEGRGLHTGRYAHLVLCPAPENFGLRFLRTDLGLEIPAVATNVTRTDRSTTLSLGEESVITVEHLLSALTGLGVDNALIKLDNTEVPILDGSAETYVRAVAPDGLHIQDAPRRYVELKEEVEVRNQADQMVYQSEKTLSEMGDKIPADDKTKVQGGIDKLKEALKGTDTAAIKSATEELTQAFYAVSEKLYQQANPQQGGAQQPGPDAGAQGGQQYYDADYKVVDEDDKNKQ